MPNEDLTDSEYRSQSLTARLIASICGVNGHVVTATDILLENLEPSDPEAAKLQRGQLILATAKTSTICIEPNYRKHEFRLTTRTALLTKDAIVTDSNQLLIRIPIGLSFILVSGDPLKSTGAEHEFYMETAPGFNIVPHFAPPNTDPGQDYPELLLLITPEPPRQMERREIEAMKRNTMFTTVSRKEMELLRAVRDSISKRPSSTT